MGITLGGAHGFQKRRELHKAWLFVSPASLTAGSGCRFLERRLEEVPGLQDVHAELAYRPGLAGKHLLFWGFVFPEILARPCEVTHHRDAHFGEQPFRIRN